MINNYSFSTVWNCSKHSNGVDIVSEINDLGFNTIELNFQFTNEKLQGIIDCVDKEKINISSIHNYCPIPDIIPLDQANPDKPSLASNQESERAKAVMYTKHTINTASQVGAKVVILHSGKVEIECRTKELIALYNSKAKESKRYKKVLNEAIDDRGNNVKEHFDALATSYSELVPYAKGKGIKIGVENRYYHRELPSPDELNELFKYFNNNVLWYWHDIGHAFVLETLGFYKQQQFLESFHKKMIGIHIHDIIKLKDHNAPFQGEFNWHFLRQYQMRDVLKVIEVHAHNSRDDIIGGIKRLDSEVFS